MTTAWDEFAERRERNQAWIAGVGAPVTEWLVDALAVRPGEHVLELAAGAGDIGFAIVERAGPDIRLVSSDISPVTLEVARRAAARRGLSGIEFRTIDGEAIDAPSASFDAVACRWGYMLMEQPGAALRETARVLRQGGRVALSVWSDRTRNPWTTLDAEICARLGFVPAVRPTDPGQMFSLADRDALRALVEQAGMTVRRLEAVALVWPYADEQHYVDVEIDRPGPRGEFFRALPAVDRRRAVHLAGELLAPYRRDAGYLVPGETLNVLAARP